jgi:glutamate dehydrogenase (NAD(P)+)
MVRAFNQVTAFARRESVDLRTAALMVGIRRIADAYQLRGFYP